MRTLLGNRYAWLAGSIVLLLLSAYLILKPTVINHMIVNPAVVENATADIASVTGDQLAENQARIDAGAADAETDVAVNDAGYTYPTSHDSNIEYDASTVNGVGEIPADATLNYDYMVGEIYMPAVDMHVPILEGVSNENLWLGAGTMKPGQQMGQGNYALAGHHMWDDSQLFTPIMDAAVGDVAYITDKNTVYEYTVTETFVAAKTEGHLVNDDVNGRLATDAALMTLVTCTDVWGSDRFIVVGELTGSYSITDADPEIAAVFVGA